VGTRYNDIYIVCLCAFLSSSLPPLRIFKALLLRVSGRQLPSAGCFFDVGNVMLIRDSKAFTSGIGLPKPIAAAKAASPSYALLLQRPLQTSISWKLLIPSSPATSCLRVQSAVFSAGRLSCLTSQLGFSSSIAVRRFQTELGASRPGGRHGSFAVGAARPTSSQMRRLCASLSALCTLGSS
jgi:hypothetical protein